jgi:hypothetical protein
MGTNRVAPRFLADCPSQSGDELRACLSRGSLRSYAPVHVALAVAFADLASKTLVHRPGAEAQDVLARRDPCHHRLDEPFEVLEPAGLPGGLRRTSSAMPNVGAMPHVARGAAMGGHIGSEPLDAGSAVRPPHQNGLARIDPDDEQRPSGVLRGGAGSATHGGHRHRAHAGLLSPATARST